MFKNMKLGVRLGLGFGVITLILVFLSVLSIMRLTDIGDTMTKIVDDRFPKTVWANNIIDQVNTVAREVRNMVLYDNIEDKQKSEAAINDAAKVIDENLEKLNKTVKSDKGKELMKKIQESRAVYLGPQKEARALALKGNSKDAKKVLFDELRPKQLVYMKAVTDLVDYQTEMVQTEAKEAKNLYNGTILLLTIISIASVIFVFVLAWFLTVSITKPISECMKVANEVAKGNTDLNINVTSKDETGQLLGAMKEMVNSIKNLVTDANMLAKAAIDGKLATRADATKHQGDYKAIVDGVNGTLDAVIGPLNVAAEYMDRIAKGDIPPKITDSYNGDFNEIKNNLNTCIDAVNLLVKDANVLADAAVEGKLATRADATRHQGDFRRIVEGVNGTLDAVIGPLNVAAEYMDRIAKGDIPPKITDSYNGDFNEIKNNLNTCIDAVNLLVNDANMLSKAAIEGKLATRADATRHQGDFRAIVKGVNETLDAVIGPLNVAAEYVDRIAKGDIPPKITDNYNGDFNELKNNLNTCIDAVNLLVMDANILAKAAVEGKLATRADASRHQGDFRKIVEGVNDTLDSVIGPLNVAAEYVDRIGKGNIPPKITDNYNGDFNEIKNNLNSCIEAVNLLIGDANMLARAAVEGKLATRADATRHQGDFLRIVEGVNGTLDAVIGPLNVAAEYVDRIAKGDIPPKITDSYNGDFNEIKNNLNTCVDAINLLVKDANILAKAAVEGKLATRADATKHQGDFQKIVEGVNNTLDSVIGPLNVAANYVDRISKGDIPAKITDSYNGDFNNIKNNLNSCIDAVNMLVADANVLAKAAVEGKLATRADATKHWGDFRKIVEGVNGTLDAVIGPLNVAAEYVDRISKGDIPAKITDSYNGDFNNIKNNLNQCIDAVNLLVGDANVLAKAAIEGKLATRADATRHWGDFRKIVEGVNGTLDAVIGPLNVAAEYVDRIAKGDIPPKITDSYNGDFNEIKNNLNTCIDSLNGLIGEMNKMATEHEKGDIDVVVDVKKFQGAYQMMAQGVNDMVNAHIAVKKKAMGVFTEFGNGNFEANMETLPGKKIFINNTIEQVRANLKALIADADMLTKAAVDGKLATRADANKHKGDFRKIVEGVNGTLDAVIGPLNVAAEYVDRIAKGDIPPKITDTYNGDFNEIKNNLNTCIDAVNLLVKDANILAKAAVEGKLATRADANKHQGDFQKIVEGVNGTLDAVIGPLNVAANYVERISKGDIPAKITDNYNGDFNNIKNNLNQCIDAVNLLVADANILAAAAVEGALSTRADATRHWGDFRKIVEGVNGTLDSVIGPLNVAANYVDRIAKGDIPPKITDNYNGDFNELKNNLNTCIDAVNLLVMDANILAKAAVEGKLATRADASRHQGDFRKIVEGVNDTLDSVIGPLNVAAEYVDRIGKGNIPPKITDNYNGDFNEIKNNLNSCIEAVNLLIGDANMLARAAVEGKLATRADATRHQGDFRRIVEGVNGTLDAVIGPLNVAAEYIDRIAKGDIPPKITDTYNGDFNEIKNNLNQCIEAINYLIADAGMLSKASVEGKLSTRADINKHQGDFRKIVEGVNDTLDAVIAPINEAVEGLKAMADGNLTVKMEGKYEGDHAIMKNSLNKALDSINEILNQVIIATEQVVDGAQQISDSSQSLSQGATEQASSIEEITSSMNQLSSQIKLNAENSNQANQLTMETRKSAESGNEQMQEMVTAMFDINDASQSIAKIIKVIDEIAFQTNLLALNAAVEAARAGKHGKGFAVVAEEVRNLAARSAKAAKETAELIENSMKKTSNGATVASKTSESLSGIVIMVTKVTDLIGEISIASNEQAQGVTQINMGLAQVDKVTQQNTANAEQSASSAEELNGQAMNLRGMLGRFKVNGHNMHENVPYQKRLETSFHGHAANKIPALTGVNPKSTKMLNPTDVISLDDDEFGRY